MFIRKVVTCLLGGVLVLWGTTAFAANGTLKVTSYPTGAEVFVDGGSTGKFTPMSVSLAEGDHEVVVQVPGGTWEPDIRTVTISPGNNDLSVTLIPTVIEGPPGPIGPAGPTGPQGPPGTDGANGADGADGAPGIGLPGLQGVQGPPGAQGLTGAAGPQGATGPRGDTGAQGPQGSTGSQGPAGPAGFGSGNQQYVWVGSSVTTGAGNQGPVNFSRYCDATFPGSRMCSTVEVIGTLYPPPETTPNAWVRPSFSGYLNAAGEAMDLATGKVMLPDDMNCWAWSTGGELTTGLIVQFDGTIRPVPCNNFLPIACCAPTN